MVRVAGHPVGLWGARPGPLTLAIRPEDLLPAGTGLPARAEALEFLGESLLLHARHEASGTALVLRLPPEMRADLPASGSLFHLQFDTTRALLFGPEGRRIGATALSAEAALV
ncbi:TOBE domain-containing protein [Pseudoroseomonas wenyumeiae]